MPGFTKASVTHFRYDSDVEKSRKIKRKKNVPATVVKPLTSGPVTTNVRPTFH